MSKTLLIGIDGGATKVSGWTTVINEDQTFQLGDINVIKEYREYEEHMPSFKPVKFLQFGEDISQFPIAHDSFGAELHHNDQ